MNTSSIAAYLLLRVPRYELRMKAELCCAGLSTADAFRPSSCLSSLSQIRRLSMGAAGSVRGFVRCQCDSNALRKLLHDTLELQLTQFISLQCCSAHAQQVTTIQVYTHFSQHAVIISVLPFVMTHKPVTLEV